MQPWYAGLAQICDGSDLTSSYKDVCSISTRQKNNNNNRE